jgi:hypothetical protein
MTGITNQLVKDAPVIDEIYEDFANFIGDHVLVSHNTIGDLIFLRHFALDTLGRDLRNFFLCTHLLVEKLAPEAPDKSLKGLSKFFSLQGENFHRAEADALQTWELFKILLMRLKNKGIAKIEHAVRLQGDLDSSLRLGWSVSKQKLQKLPQGPGLFYLLEHDGRTAFLSSAVSVVREVAKLRQHDLIPRNILKAALRSYDIEVKETDCIFDAMVLESEDRERLKLQLDPVLLHQRQSQVIGLYEVKGGGFRLTVGPLEESASEFFGPVSDRKRAVEFIEDLADILQEKRSKNGMTVSQDNLELVRDFFSGCLLEHQRKIERTLFGLRFLFWRKKEYRECLLVLDKINAMLALAPKGFSPWPSIKGVNGVMAIPINEGRGWSVYPVVCGFPLEQVSVKGDLFPALERGLRVKLLRKIEASRKKRSRIKHLKSSEVGKINAVLWWTQFGKSKDNGLFMDIGSLNDRKARKGLK